jgi:hypothetical protein
LAGGVVGSYIVSKRADKRSQEMKVDAASLDGILASSPTNYSIDYTDVQRIEMKKKALPIGYSRAHIRSRHRNVSFAFKREMFDDVDAIFKSALPGKTS